ncbi:hypothetical protein ES703_27615 [subsurface metagenome]
MTTKGDKVKGWVIMFVIVAFFILDKVLEGVYPR